jgi:ABC-type amino acid transport substrate-binding protein
VQKGNATLVDKINTGLANVMASNYWDQLIEKYFAT